MKLNIPFHSNPMRLLPLFGGCAGRVVRCDDEMRKFVSGARVGAVSGFEPLQDGHAFVGVSA